MRDEIGTDTTCSDARSAEQVLFGDDVDDAAALAVNEEAPEAEAEQDLEDPDDAGGQAVAQEELKVVFHQGRQGHHRSTTTLVGPAYRGVRWLGPDRGWPRRPRRW